MTENIPTSTYKEQKRGENAKDLRKKLKFILISSKKDRFPLSRE